MYKTNYNFKVELTLLSNGNERVLNQAVKTIHILKNYITNIMPLYVFDLSLSVDDLEDVMNNDVQFILNISRFNRADEDIDNTTEVVVDKNILSVLLKPLNKVKYEINQYSEVDNTGDAEDTAKSKIYSYQLKCLPVDVINTNNSIINEIYKDTDVASAIVNMLSKVYKGNAYIQQPKNELIYNNIIIPPMNFTNAVKFVDEKYGIYTSDVNVFIDNDIAYIYSINDNNIVDKTLTINVLQQTLNNDNSIYQTYYGDDNGNISITLKSPPMISLNNDIADYAVGKKTIFNSYDDNYNLSTKQYENNSDIAKTRYFWNNSTYINEMFTMSSATKSGTIGLVNVDFSNITPATKIVINGSTLQHVNDDYQVILTDATIDTADYDTYTSSINISFAK